MGCGGSKEGENPNEIKYELKDTKVPALDEFFKSASEFLEGLEGLRAAFEETRADMNEIGRTDELATPSLLEAIKVFFWSVSAHKDGNIKAAGIDYTMDPPAFTVNCKEMDIKTYDFSAAMKELIGGLVNGPKQIADLGGKLKEISDKTKELSGTFKDTIKESGLGPMEQAKAVGYAGSNFATISKGLAKAPNVLEQSKAAITDVKAMLPKIKPLMDEADVTGKEASAKGVKKIDEIFDQYQKAQRKTPEQIKAEHKTKKPKAHKKKGKKEEGKEHGKDHGKEQGKDHGKEHGKEGHEHKADEGHEHKAEVHPA
jgi:hypothetical protein